MEVLPRGRPSCLNAGFVTDIFPLWEPGLSAMQAPRSIWMTEVLPSRASPLPQGINVVVATRLSRRRECPSLKAERRCCYVAP